MAPIVSRQAKPGRTAIRALSGILIGDLGGVVRLGLGRSVVSLLIKVGAAGLTYAMFVTLARVTDTVEYGLFAFGFSLATFIAVIASSGQHTAVMRFWPEEEVAGKHSEAVAALASGWALTLIGGAALTMALCAATAALAVLNPGAGPLLHVFAAAALIVPMAAAEFASSALRAQDSVWLALTPRDIVWRFVVPIVSWALFATGYQLTGAAALMLAAILLYLVLGLQAVLAAGRFELRPGLKALSDYWRRRGAASRWFWLAAVLDSAALNIDIILVGLLLTPEDAGVYFSAFRTAALMTLLMYAINTVISPMVSRYYHSGDRRRAQAIASFCAWAGFGFSLAVFGGFVVFGEWLLSLFGPDYAGGYLALIVLSVGFLFDAANGPTRVVMVMTGHERQYVTITAIANAVAVVLFVAMIPLFGVLAAAVINAAARAASNVAISVWARRHVGIDPSLFGIERLAGRPGNAG